MDKLTVVMKLLRLLVEQRYTGQVILNFHQGGISADYKKNETGKFAFAE